MDKSIAITSVFFKKMFEADNNEDEIVLPNITSNVLRKVIVFCKYITANHPPDIAKPIKSDKMIENVTDAWYADYIKIDNEFLYELATAANFLEISPLLELACSYAASQIKGKNSCQIRELFNLDASSNSECPQKMNSDDGSKL